MNSTPSVVTTATQKIGLPAYNGPWGKAQAAHLVRRTHFGNKISDLNRIRSFENAAVAAATLVDEAANAILPDDPTWFTNNNSGDIIDMYDIQFRRWMVCTVEVF